MHDAVRLFYTEQKHKEIDAIITYACVGIILVEISATSIFLGGVNMKSNNLDARFKCHMDTDINHYKANFINIAIKKNNVSASENSKTSFSKRLEWKDIADVWWPPICLSRSLKGIFHRFCMGIEIIKSFSFKWNPQGFSLTYFYHHSIFLLACRQRDSNPYVASRETKTNRFTDWAIRAPVNIPYMGMPELSKIHNRFNKCRIVTC